MAIINKEKEIAMLSMLLESWVPPILLSAVIGLMLSDASPGAFSEYSALSPDGKVDVKLTCTESHLTYSLSWNGRKKGASLGDEALFKLYSELGAAGIKYGFMGNNAGFTRKAVEQSAKNNLLIDFHDDPCPMTGICRTLPNCVTREFCHAQQDSRRAFSPKAFLKMAVINALSGPLDQNNGVYGLNGVNNGERQRGPSKRNSYNSTVVSETARTLIIFSGLIILPDAPEEYEKKSDLFEFIRQMPATWDESRVINSRIGEYITTARRSGDQWFVGSVINEEGGSVKIPLDFLEKRKTYDITFYEDAPESHYIKNRESYQVRTGKVTSEDSIEAQMASGGGHCMWIRPANKAIDGDNR